MMDELRRAVVSGPRLARVVLALAVLIVAVGTRGVVVVVSAHPPGQPADSFAALLVSLIALLGVSAAVVTARSVVSGMDRGWSVFLALGFLGTALVTFFSVGLFLTPLALAVLVCALLTLRRARST